VNIGVSTVAFSGFSIEQMIEIAKSNAWILEFSSGLEYRDDLGDVFLNADIQRLPHNYFPPPRVPFVINLASSSNQILEKTITHCLQGLKLAGKSGAAFYSVHAGFCLDPDPSELGNALKNTKFDRERHWQIFMASLERLLKATTLNDPHLLIENNVISQKNMMGGENPLFCCDVDEVDDMIKHHNHDRLGLLLDTGHLKVSSETLGFDLERAVRSLKHCVKAIHHSDNNGKFDNNAPIDEHYWFLPYMRYFKDCYHILEVKNQLPEQIARQLSILTDT